MLTMRHLHNLSLCRRENGLPHVTLGNSAIIFKVLVDEQPNALRCYIHPKVNVEDIYGSQLLRKELYVSNGEGVGEWVDVVLMPWHEGQTLTQEIRRHISEHEDIEPLLRHFESFALNLLNCEWAHGDLTPDNIIVGPTGEMHTIDYDAMYHPSFASQDTDEMGTCAFSHPNRSMLHDKHIDDYGIALINTVLAALVLDSTLLKRYSNCEGLIIDPAEAVAGTSVALKEIEELFASAGDARHYRLAQLLRSSRPNLPTIAEYIGVHITPYNGELRLGEQNGLWGYTDTQGHFVIAPLYDYAFDFSDEQALVCLGGKWHTIDRCGCVVSSSSNYQGVPLRHGATALCIRDEKQTIDP